MRIVQLTFKETEDGLAINVDNVGTENSTEMEKNLSQRYVDTITELSKQWFQTPESKESKEKTE